MKITDITVQAKNANRVNIFIDGKYRLSLDVFQLGSLGLKRGDELSEERIIELEEESQFGKTYARALEYCLMRPHSKKEVRDYLWRKTRPSLTKSGQKKEGIKQEMADAVLQRLVDKGYVDDASFTRYWLENRNQTKGTSRRKLVAELRAKGVDVSVIEQALPESGRDDSVEIRKIIARRASKYDDEQKLMRYLAGQGFTYDQIKEALSASEE